MKRRAGILETKDRNLEYIDVDFEVKAINDEDPDFFIFEGFASTFGNIDLVDDIVVRGAFVESLLKRIPVVLWQHDHWQPIGMPVEVKETEEGLFFKARLPKADTFVSGRVIPQIKIGSIRSMSIGFRIVESEVNSDGIRLLQKVDLLEVSLVTFPANEMARVSGFKASLDQTNMSDADKVQVMANVELYQSKLEEDQKKQFYNVEEVKSLTKRDLEKALRESGVFSKDAAVLIASKVAERGEPAGDDGNMKQMLASLAERADEHLKSSAISNITQKVNSHGT